MAALIRWRYGGRAGIIHITNGSRARRAKLKLC